MGAAAGGAGGGEAGADAAPGRAAFGASERDGVEAREVVVAGCAVDGAGDGALLASDEEADEEDKESKGDEQAERLLGLDEVKLEVGDAEEGVLDEQEDEGAQEHGGEGFPGPAPMSGEEPDHNGIEGKEEHGGDRRGGRAREGDASLGSYRTCQRDAGEGDK